MQKCEQTTMSTTCLNPVEYTIESVESADRVPTTWYTCAGHIGNVTEFVVTETFATGANVRRIATS